MLQTIKAHLGKLSNYPRLRILLIIIAVIIVFVFIMNVLSPTRDTNRTPPSSVETATPGNTPATSVPQNNATQYQQLANTAQQQAVQQANQSGGTIFENAFNNNTNGTTTTSTPNAVSQNQNNTSQTTPNAQNAMTNTISPEAFSGGQQVRKSESTGQDNDSQNNPQNAALSAQVQSLQEQLSTAQQQQRAQQQTQIQTAMGNIEASMRNGLQNVSSSWNLPTQATVGGGSSGSTPSGGGSTPQPPVSIKAGSILFGVIDTALDSDQPGTPVLAHIVEGPLRGAHLMGGFTLAGKALVVQFNTMSLPTSPASFGINAYAVDAKTANNSVATSVNNHYLLRYGMLFAAAFLQGFGNAYQNYTYNCPPGTQNCSVVNTNSSGVTTQNNSVTTSEAFYQGLGQIGTNVGQAAAQEFNTPPTVKVASGTGIGVLFMSDVRVPIN